MRDCLLEGSGEECGREEVGIRGVGDYVDYLFGGAVEGSYEDVRKEGAVCGHSAECVKLEEGYKVVCAEGEDDAEVLGFRRGCIWQEGVLNVI